MKPSVSVIVLAGLLFSASASLGQSGSTGVASGDKICGSAAARVAVQKLEAEITKDPNGQLLGGLLGGQTGTKAEVGEGQLVKLEPFTGNYPGKTPESVACYAVFVHRNAGLTPQQEADEAARMTAAIANQMLKSNNSYHEHYQVTPLGGDSYKLRLIPEGLQLSKEYTSEITSR
jgi:hypothetical protein